mgnify:CR=1 FL=1
MHRKKRLRLASANRGTLNAGWYGIGRPHSAKQAEDGGERREENGHLERDDDVRRPAMQRASGDVDGV